MKYLLISILRLYQTFFSPFIISIIGHACRFDPTCSQYAVDSIHKYGSVKGSLKALQRLSRCHPFSKSVNYYDPA